MLPQIFFFNIKGDSKFLLQISRIGTGHCNNYILYRNVCMGVSDVFRWKHKTTILVLFLFQIFSSTAENPNTFFSLVKTNDDAKTFFQGGRDLSYTTPVGEHIRSMTRFNLFVSSIKIKWQDLGLN